MKPTYRKSWAGYLLTCSDLTLSPTFKVEQRTAKLKSAYNLLIIGPRGLQCETNLEEIMGLESTIWPLATYPRSNDGPQALVSCLSGGYKFASVLRCVGLVDFVAICVVL